VKENGEADPLRKTLLIIDEAHKLYGGGDLSSIERPDMVALHESLMKSYAISGDDSVRLLLMTATPITESPMELIQLINLCKPIDEQMPHTFESFSSHYLDNEGHFTNKGQHEYLDNIAGHISYLNREKDARQFAQPIVKRVMVPIVSDVEMEKVKKYDKYILRTDVDENIVKLKDQAEKASEFLTDELSEMQKERFQYLRKKCETSQNDILSKNRCNKIINSNIKTLVGEIKEYVKSIKSQMKTINVELQMVAKSKMKGLESIRKNIETHPEDFENYKNSTYFSLRTICGKRVRTNKELLENLKEHPKIIKYNAEIKEHEDHIEMMKNRLKIDNEAYKLRLKQLRDFLRTSDLSDLERSVIQLTIKDHQKKFRKTKKITAKTIQDDLEDDQEAIKLLEDNKKEVYHNVRKTMKNMIRQEKKELNVAKKEEKRLRRTMHKQGELKEEIKDEEINKIVNKYEEAIDDELKVAKEERQINIHEKEQEQIKKQEKKRQETEKKRQETEKKRQETEKKRQEKKEQADKKRTLKLEKKKEKKEQADKKRTLKLEKEARKTKRRSPL
jgi:hypothetical protein